MIPIYDSFMISAQQKPEFWIVCSFIVTCLFLWRTAWPWVRKGVTNQQSALAETFQTLTERKNNARAHTDTLAQKQAEVQKIIDRKDAETRMIIDHMRTHNIAQRAHWQKHTIASIDRTLDRERRIVAIAGTDKLIEELTSVLTNDSKETLDFQKKYTHAMITHMRKELKNRDKHEKGEGSTRPSA
ncbi:MAG: hypothetical protein H6849_03140 [Alphaproteobacteria bacterium]|nr:MAG: hypothetical protein H6849_03140 [Alphaproteobacteria bacterium]